jgi:hypothetical protein
VAVLKCAHCNKRFKKSDEIVVVDNNYKEAVHVDCHYDYLCHFHLNTYYTYDEFKEALKEENEL